MSRNYESMSSVYGLSGDWKTSLYMYVGPSCLDNIVWTIVNQFRSNICGNICGTVVIFVQIVVIFVFKGI